MRRVHGALGGRTALSPAGPPGTGSDHDLGRELQHLVQGLGLGLGQDDGERILLSATIGGGKAGGAVSSAAWDRAGGPCTVPMPARARAQRRPAAAACSQQACGSAAGSSPALPWADVEGAAEGEEGAHQAGLLGAADRGHNGALQLRHLAELDLVGLRGRGAGAVGLRFAHGGAAARHGMRPGLGAPLGPAAQGPGGISQAEACSPLLRAWRTRDLETVMVGSLMPSMERRGRVGAAMVGTTGFLTAAAKLSTCTRSCACRARKRNHGGWLLKLPRQCANMLPAGGC